MNFIKSVYAGLVIGLGGYVYLGCDNKVVGAFLFSIGLLAVLTFGFNLYTGKVCYTKYLARPKKLAAIWAGNLLGAWCMAFLAAGHGNVINTAKMVVDNKLTKNPGVLLLDSIICGFCIAIAVKGFARAADLGKHLLVVLGVMVFILGGAEHCVADMFYLFCGRVYSLSGLMLLVIVTLGNTLGGIVFSWL